MYEEPSGVFVPFLKSRDFEGDFDRMTRLFDLLRSRFNKIDQAKTDEVASAIDRVNKKFEAVRKISRGK
jgi:hypothetical protein